MDQTNFPLAPCSSSSSSSSCSNINNYDTESADEEEINLGLYLSPEESCERNIGRGARGKRVRLPLNRVTVNDDTKENPESVLVKPQRGKPRKKDLPLI